MLVLSTGLRPAQEHPRGHRPQGAGCASTIPLGPARMSGWEVRHRRGRNPRTRVPRRPMTDSGQREAISKASVTIDVG